MLGTVHRDQEGGTLLSQWLHCIRPDLVTLEFSHYGMRFRQRWASVLHERLERSLEKLGFASEESRRDAAGALYEYIDLPYEYTEAARYAERWGASMHLLDLDTFSLLNLTHLDELLDEENLKAWLGSDRADGDRCAKERALARLFVDKGVRAFEYTAEMVERDRHIAASISFLGRRHKGKRILHVCGWRHLADCGGLYRSLNPIKVFIHDRTLRV